MGSQPRIRDLEPTVADGISLWVDKIEQKEAFGLWLWGPPRVGTTYAAIAALNELGRIPAYNHQHAEIRAAYDVYTDLRQIFDASTYAQGHASDGAAWAERDQIEQEVAALWDCSFFVLNDWSDTVPVKFFMKHFYPLVRRRISAAKPTIIVTRFNPSVTGSEERYFREEFVVVEMTQRGHGTR
jgi:hypothetical protein